MVASAVVYMGIVIALAGSAFVIKPMLWVTTRRRGLATIAVGAVAAAVGLALPAMESRVARAQTRLDEFAPVWQFNEFHSIRIAAPPERVFEAVKAVKADEIALFDTLMRIRYAGRNRPPGMGGRGGRESLIDVATGSTFLRLADDPPRELVIGAVVIAPPGRGGRPTPDLYRQPVPPGFALATMNFLVTPYGDRSCVLSTETRVFASGASARRRFAAYWRLIYPGSSLIRRMWLRAIRRRAEDPDRT